MSYVVRRLQKMDLSFFHAHGADAPGHQRAVNNDGWLVPYLAIPAPSMLTLRFRHPDSGRLTIETRPFGRLHKNYRIHGEMIRGAGFGGFGIGDTALLRFVGQNVAVSCASRDGLQTTKTADREYPDRRYGVLGL